MPTNKQPQHDIISLEDDAKVPDTFGLERFMEEVNILELEGYYFSPNRKQGAKRAAKPLSLGQIADHPVTISLSEHGQPGEGAYKLLQASFFKLSQQGPDTDGVVLFSRRELSRLLDTSFGGRQSSNFYKFIKQLHRTEVNCAIRFKEKTDKGWQKKWRVVSFSFVSRVAFEGSVRGRFAQCALKFDEMIARNFRNKHISYFNWERLRGLEMVSMMLYKRFFRHMANIYHESMDKNELKFEKDYEQVCTGWLGLKPLEQRSRIEKQLGRYLESLKRVRLLRECRIEPKADGSGFKIVGYAGSGFFADYENIYLRRAPATLPGKDISPLMILHDFHKALGHEQEEFAAKEVTYARELLARYGADGVRDFIEFSLSEARKTEFHNMRWFGVLSIYEGSWKARRQKLSQNAGAPGDYRRMPGVQ